MNWKNAPANGPEKLLTISVAAYNGEKTLDRALKSCLEANSHLLEVIVVDDGSTDGTARIAEEYVARRPDCFRLIRQKNGGYGSTIIAALAQARGRYFRTLDCDDWFDPMALAGLLRYLESCSTDVVITNYCTVQEEQIRQQFLTCRGRKVSDVYTFDRLDGIPLDMEIHGMTMRTQMLRAAHLQLPGHCSYTDMAYTFFGLAAARTLSFCPVMLYYYRLGRDGQSVSLESYQKHFDDYAQVTELVLAAADSLSDDARGTQLKNRARDIAQYGIELLLRFPPSAEAKQRLVDYDTALCTRHPGIARRMKNKNTRLLRASGYGLYGMNIWWKKRKIARAEDGESATGISG